MLRIMAWKYRSFMTEQAPQWVTVSDVSTAGWFAHCHDLKLNSGLESGGFVDPDSVLDVAGVG